MSNADEEGVDTRSEEELRGQGVVPQYSLSDLGVEEDVEFDVLPTISESAGSLPPYSQGCPSLMIGGSAFGKGIFSDDDLLNSVEPYRVVRLALRYGIRAIDTSPFYHPSEISLGRILEALKDQYPRSSYYLQTKVGRYGQKKEDFDYSPERVRKSIAESLRRLKTTYLDSVVLHDVEFVCENVGPSQSAGFAARDLLTSEQVARACGLTEAKALIKGEDHVVLSRIHGPGDEAILAAARTLFQLKDEGVVRNVGIGGYPLPVLLRLSRLIACSPPFRPLDVIVSYCHRTLQSDLLRHYQPLFEQDVSEAQRAAAAHVEGVNAADAALESWHAPMIVNASPFSMGLLTDAGPPNWHPAGEEIRTATQRAVQHIRATGGQRASLAAAAAQFGFPSPGSTVERPTIVGMNSIDQVHRAMEACQIKRVGGGVASSSDEELRLQYEQRTSDADYTAALYEQRHLRNWCWSSP